MPPKRSNTRSSPKSKSADLERIRNNQRRCRARQKDYIAELKDKIRAYENSSSLSSGDPRLQELTKENESLKRLLQSLGLGHEFLKAYHRAERIVPRISQAPADEDRCFQNEVDNPSMTPTVTLEIQNDHVPAPSEAPSHDALQSFENATEVDALLSWDPFIISDTLPQTLEPLQTDNASALLSHLTAEPPMTEGSCNTREENISDSTTLCSWAFSLVLKNNAKGLSAADLDLKLRVGYRYSNVPSEGCRVDNKTLLSVLAEIS